MNYNIPFIIAQILGIIVFITGVISYSKKETKQVYLYNGLTNGLCVIEYVLLGAYTGAISCLIATIRNIIFINYKKKIPLSYLVIYLVVAVLINSLFIKSFIDIIPVFNIVIFSIALWTKNIRHIKVTGIMTCTNGVIFNTYKQAYTSILYEAVCGIAGIHALIEINRSKKKFK